MKKYIYFSFAIMALLLLATPVLAATEEAKEGGLIILVDLVTLIVVGGIIYNIFAGVGGFGGIIGKALKTIGAGILVLSLNTIDEVIEGLAGIGSSSLLGEGLIHDVFHAALPLLGFIILAFGLTQLTKFIKSVK